MITIIGATLGIPDTVMGLTFVAAGVSIPDALSSIAVIKEGYGDMAVSNAVGSNVFDILVCLGLPWLIQTTILAPGTHVNVISKGTIHINTHKRLTDALSIIYLYRTHIFNTIAIVNRGVSVDVGTFEWLEIGSSSRYHSNGVVFHFHCCGNTV